VLRLLMGLLLLEHPYFRRKLWVVFSVAKLFRYFSFWMSLKIFLIISIALAVPFFTIFFVIMNFITQIQGYHWRFAFETCMRVKVHAFGYEVMPGGLQNVTNLQGSG
jgi:hypothetical protein